MSNKIVFGIVGLVVIGAGYFLLSPLWRSVKLDEPLPQLENTQNSGNSVSELPPIEDSMDTMDAETKKQFMTKTDAMKDEIMKKDEAMSSNEPAVLAQASMIARAHDVEGKALLVQVGDQKILRFENLKTINGPDLHIYLASGLSSADAVDLGAIRATEGNVNYTVPAGTDTSKYRYVLIWCRPFNVLFSYAQF